MTFFRGVVILLSFISLFVFPYPLTLLLSFVASLCVPWIALLLGLLADALYYTPLPAGESGLSFPYATLIGMCLTLLALFVRRFVRERIMQG
jgi:Na+/H+ antiporter NhaA